MAVVGAIFAIVCLVFFIRMVNITVNAGPKQISTDTYERREPIQALRGQIYDRNGRVLVYNEYSYDMIFDYDAMAATNIDRNYAILQAVYAINSTGNADKRVESSFPFDGTYPNYTYSAEARDTESDIYYRLLKRIAEDELEEESERAKDELTVSYLYEFYAQKPDAFPKEEEIVEWFLERYKINVTDSSENPLFTDKQIDTIIRVRYDMEVADFSVYNRYVFARGLDVSFISYLKEVNVVGADFVTSAERKYAYPGYASHILGRVGSIPAERWEYYKELGYQMNDKVGLDGCESVFEEYLRGIDGVRVVVEDNQGNIIDSWVEKEPVAGKDVYLTIDIDLQMAAEDGLELNVKALANAEAGAAVALDPRNGEILAIASYPTFDLTTYGQNYNELIADANNPLYNRALDGLYAPGSTFKLGMVAAGVSSGTVKATDLINCSGRYTYYAPSYMPKCWIYPGSHGNIDAVGALKVSCNCYFFELGRLMGIDLMNEYCSGYGFGEYTGVELGEKKGILAGPLYREMNGLEIWKPGNTIAAAIGQSDNNFTPIQIASYLATLLNGGTRYSAHLFLEAKEYGSEVAAVRSDSTVLNTVALSSEAVNAVKEGMRQMVESSAYVSRYMKDLPVTVGGKTGTAELGGTAEENGLFVCAAPYNDPEIVIFSVIEHAGGGSYATITASEILKEYYAEKE